MAPHEREEDYTMNTATTTISDKDLTAAAIAPVVPTDPATPAPEKKRARRTETHKAETKETGAASLGAKLVQACAEMPAALKNASNPFSKSKYADLASVMNAIRPSLAKHGLMISQPVSTRTAENGALFVAVETIISDGAEEISSGVIEIPAVGNNIAQAIGSAITYARRYSATSFLGIASEDDDGLAAGNTGGALCPPALANEARNAAAGGAQAYAAFWEKLARDEKRTLVDSGIHAEIKAQLGGANV